MSKQSKFRVWDKVKGDFFDKAFEDVTMSSDGIFYFIGHGKIIEEIDSERYNIQHFTGIKDKNNVEIYEGDILSVELFGRCGQSIAKSLTSPVEWKDGGFGFKFGTRMDFKRFDNFVDSTIFRIESHIHEVPKANLNQKLGGETNE